MIASAIECSENENKMGSEGPGEAKMPSYIYAGAAPWIAASKDAPTGGLYRLDVDTGRWEKLTSGLPDGVEARCVAAQPGAPGILYVGTQSGPYRSTDGGDSWIQLDLPGKDKLVWSILLHPKDARTIYVGTEGTTIYRSRDGGQSWQELTPPAPLGMVKTSFPCRVIRLALDPGDPDRLYAALEVGGVMRSDDGGDSWAGCNEGLLEFTKEPRLRSRIVSNTETEGMMDSHALATTTARPGAVFLANRMGLFHSRDGGARWHEIGIGRFSRLTYARDVKVSQHDPRTMYAALSVAAVSDEGALYRSRDLGETWQRFDHGVSMTSTLMAVAESPDDPERIYCATRKGQVFGTTDGGKRWQEYTLPDGVEGIYGLCAA
jgi:photosystem II stability/assembly factor-like uncharacterized protein